MAEWLLFELDWEMRRVNSDPQGFELFVESSCCF
jgi:hypothetical protein